MGKDGAIFYFLIPLIAARVAKSRPLPSLSMRLPMRRADLIVRALATARRMDAAPARGWLAVDVVDVERCEGIEDRPDYGLRQAGLARALDAEGLTVVG
jgi:hypothetical protein